LKIAFDATAVPREKAGAAKYVINLLKALAEIDKDNIYFIFVQSDDLESFRFDNPNFRLIPVSSRFMRRVPLRLVWEQTILPLRLKKLGAQCLHSPHYTTPVMSSVPAAVNFHDMGFILFPRLYTTAKRVLFPIYLKMSAKKAGKILVISRATAADAKRVLNISEDKIEVTLMGKEDVFKPVPDQEIITEVMNKYKINSKYILFVGTLEPRKNILNLLRAFQIVKNNLLFKKFKLVIVGKKGWFYEEIFRFVRQNDMQEDVIITGFVPLDDMPYLYNGSEVFVYPSLYEGFGIPVLEALACGVPSITSNVSSMPEVIGNAGMTVNPNDVFELAQVMVEVLSDPKSRHEMRNKALEQAEKFSWQECAQRTLRVYESLEHK